MGKSLSPYCIMQNKEKVTEKSSRQETHYDLQTGSSGHTPSQEVMREFLKTEDNMESENLAESAHSLSKSNSKYGNKLNAKEAQDQAMCSIAESVSAARDISHSVYFQMWRRTFSGKEKPREVVISKLAIMGGP